jgi:ABC-type methionine transport system permease subunit
MIIVKLLFVGYWKMNAAIRTVPGVSAGLFKKTKALKVKPLIRILRIIASYHRSLIFILLVVTEQFRINGISVFICRL